MAIIDFEIEFKMRAPVRMDVPDCLESILDEHSLRKLLMEKISNIVHYIPKEQCNLVRGSAKIITKPEFLHDTEIDTMIGLSRFPDLSLNIKPYESFLNKDTDVNEEESKQ